MLDLKEQINATLGELLKTSLIFTEDQWELMEDLVKVLAPCEKITRELSSPRNPSISRVIGLLNIFFNNIFYISILKFCVFLFNIIVLHLLNFSFKVIPLMKLTLIFLNKNQEEGTENGPKFVPTAMLKRRLSCTLRIRFHNLKDDDPDRRAPIWSFFQLPPS
jgi:hypothetical protein